MGGWGGWKCREGGWVCQRGISGERGKADGAGMGGQGGFGEAGAGKVDIYIPKGRFVGSHLGNNITILPAAAFVLTTVYDT